MEIKYKQKSMNGLKNNHTYIVEFSKPKREYTYLAHIIFDVTDKEEMDKYMNYASQISIKRYWELDKVEIDND